MEGIQLGTFLYLQKPWWQRSPHGPRRRTGQGNGTKYMEQHWRPGGATRGKKQVRRFPIPEGTQGGTVESR